MKGDSVTQYTVRHRKFLKDWSKVIVVCDDWDEVKSTVLEIMNMPDGQVAEVTVYDPLSSKTSTMSPAYENGDRLPFRKEEVK